MLEETSNVKWGSQLRQLAELGFEVFGYLQLACCVITAAIHFVQDSAVHGPIRASRILSKALGPGYAGKSCTGSTSRLSVSVDTHRQG